MRIFSILQATLQVAFPYGELDAHQTLDFSQDPDDSSVVRLRITPPHNGKDELPGDAMANELEFDRNGRVRNQRHWPMRYPAWDKRTPEEIDKAQADLDKSQAEATAAVAQDQRAAGAADAKAAKKIEDPPAKNKHK